MGVILALAVPGRLGTQPQGAQGIADTGFQNPAVDFRDVPGRGSFVIESVGGDVRCLIHFRKV